MDNCNICNRPPNRPPNHPPARNDVIEVQDAIIEDISTYRRTVYVTISYGVPERSSMIHIQLVTLIVSENTRVQDQFGRRLPASDLREGMVIDAVFSSAMTRSIPPQTNAFQITVKNRQGGSVISIGRVLEVDTRNNFLYTGFANILPSQMRYVITNSTAIWGMRGRMRLRDIRPGQTVRVEHATFQTASIPPQTTAFTVWVI